MSSPDPDRSPTKGRAYALEGETASPVFADEGGGPLERVASKTVEDPDRKPIGADLDPKTGKKMSFAERQAGGGQEEGGAGPAEGADPGAADPADPGAAGGERLLPAEPAKEGAHEAETPEQKAQRKLEKIQRKKAKKEAEAAKAAAEG